MSTSEESDGPTEIPNLDEREEAWKCDGKRVRVKVFHDDRFVEIPTTEVETFVQSEGISARNTLSRVKFPFEWQGHRVVDLIDSWVGRETAESTFDVVTVEWYDVDFDEWLLVQTGWMRGIGGTDNNDVGKFIVSGFEQILSEIAASKNFNNAEYEDLFQYIKEEIKNAGLKRVYEETGLELKLQLSTERITVDYQDEGFADVGFSGVEDSEVFIGTPSTGLNPDAELAGDSVVFNKHFKSNEHTLTDIVNFATDVTNDEWFFDPQGNLTVLKNPDGKRTFFLDRGTIEFEPASEVRSSIKVLDNNALKEISPINAVWIEGDTTGHIGRASKLLPFGLGLDDTKNVPDATEEYPFAAAWYPPLMNQEVTDTEILGTEPNSKKAGVGRTISTEDKTPSKAENHARKQLKEEITTIGEGDMTLQGKPQVFPNDKVFALPVYCGIAQDTDALTYNVESVKHHQKNGKKYTSTVDATIFVDENKIESSNTTFEI